MWWLSPPVSQADERVFSRIIGCGRKDVVHAIVELAAVRGKVGAVNSVRSLEDQRYGQTDDQMDQHERQEDQQRRFPQHYDRQNEHVGEVECLAREKDGVFTRRMLGALQIIVGREEKGFKVPEENIVEREKRVKEQRIDVLEPVHARAWLMGRKSKDAASGKRIVFALEIDAGVVAAMMENAPHVRVDSANIKNIIQELC